jgi:hypothetical protein
MASGGDSVPRDEIVVLVAFEMHAPRPARHMQVVYGQIGPIFSRQIQKDANVIQNCKRTLTLCRICGTTPGSLEDPQA